MNLWERWVRHTGRMEDRRPLAFVRVLVPLVLLGDLLSMLWHDAVHAILLPGAMGGIGSTPAGWAVVDEVWWGGEAAWLACALALPLVSARIMARPALIVALLALSQLGHLFVPGDRGIDRMLRTVLLVLLFSRVTARERTPQVEAWPSDLIRWFLVLVYLSAGVAKLDPDLDWIFGDPPELYQILADPLGGRLDPERWYGQAWLFQLGGAATLVIELSAPLLLTRWAPLWALAAAPIHLGIAAMMDLGMFSWGMLAMYPVLFGPWVGRAQDWLASRVFSARPASDRRSSGSSPGP